MVERLELTSGETILVGSQQSFKLASAIEERMIAQRDGVGG